MVPASYYNNVRAGETEKDNTFTEVRKKFLTWPSLLLLNLVELEQKWANGTQNSGHKRDRKQIVPSHWILTCR